MDSEIVSKGRCWIESFEEWRKAESFSEQKDFGKSDSLFQNAARMFFGCAIYYPEIARPLNEYSTLMDAFSKIEKARKMLLDRDYENSLSLMSDSCEILRATIHFTFLAPYVSACVTLEAASEMDGKDSETFDSLRNAVALFEQAKLALVMRDDKNATIATVDAMLKFAISRALQAEGESLDAAGDREIASRKYAQSIAVSNDHLELAARAKIEPGRIKYFPCLDYSQALNGAFIVCYPDAINLVVANVGSSDSNLKKIGKNKLERRLNSGSAFLFPLSALGEGRHRLVYSDITNNLVHDIAALNLA